MTSKPPKWPRNLTPEERADAASDLMNRIVDQVLELTALNENNRIIVYSPTLSGQIPRSRAANAFNLFQHVQLRHELIRLGALWDRAEANRISLQTIHALVDDHAVKAVLRARIRASWGDEDRFGEEQATRLMQWLEGALAVIPRIAKSARLADLKNFRDKKLAHALTMSNAESRGVVFKPPKYGFERTLLRVSITLTRRLCLGIRNTDFDFQNSRRIARRNAESLWNHCQFGVD